MLVGSDQRWAGIITTIHWWIIAVMSLVVLAGTFTVVFLSWIRVLLNGSSLIVVYVIFFLVGLAMFLNPFIPARMWANWNTSVDPRLSLEKVV